MLKRGTHSSLTPIFAHSATDDFGCFGSGFICGKSMTSPMANLPVMSITRRSMPMPMPNVGGMPYCRARRKSWSIIIASSSPLSASRIWSMKRCSWSIGSFSSE